jgi:hypothetical protein
MIDPEDLIFMPLTADDQGVQRRLERQKQKRARMERAATPPDESLAFQTDGLPASYQASRGGATRGLARFIPWIFLGVVGVVVSVVVAILCSL